jgi:hypothetical protein
VLCIHFLFMTFCLRSSCFLIILHYQNFRHWLHLRNLFNRNNWEIFRYLTLPQWLLIVERDKSHWLIAELFLIRIGQLTTLSQREHIIKQILIFTFFVTLTTWIDHFQRCSKNWTCWKVKYTVFTLFQLKLSFSDSLIGQTILSKLLTDFNDEIGIFREFEFLGLQRQTDCFWYGFI